MAQVVRAVGAAATDAAGRRRNGVVDDLTTGVDPQALGSLPALGRLGVPV